MVAWDTMLECSQTGGSEVLCVHDLLHHPIPPAVLDFLGYVRVTVDDLFRHASLLSAPTLSSAHSSDRPANVVATSVAQHRTAEAIRHSLIVRLLSDVDGPAGVSCSSVPSLLFVLFCSVLFCSVMRPNPNLNPT